MTQPFSAGSYRTSIRLLMCLVTAALSGVARSDPPCLTDMPGPATEPADLLSREYATGNWFGLRDDLKKRGIAVDLQLFGDYSHNFHGGLQSGDALRYLVNFNVALETEPLLRWKGGTFFIGLQTYAGRNASEKLTGDVQGFDNIDTRDFTQFSELWYEQKLLNETLRIKVGKVDVNTEFAGVEYGGEFLNSSTGFSPTILGIPSYPDPAAAIMLFAEPADWWYAGAGVFDGATLDGSRGRTGSGGPSTFLGNPADLFLIGETGFKWALKDSALKGRLGLGGWRHTGSFDRFDGGTGHGTTGFYLVVDQLLWREHPAATEDEQGIGAFLQYGWADSAISSVHHHVAAGLAWSGAIPSRDRDVLGIMASYVHFSNAVGADFSGSGELAIEAFYRIQLKSWISFKPDLQYIINPGGSNAANALVLTLRTELAF